MQIINCRKCGKIFSYISGPYICKECREAEEEEFKLVKEYLYKNPKATATEIASDTGVSVKKILRFLREGRLVVSSDSPITIKCESCGREIRSGRYCEECAKKLSREIEASINREVGKRVDRTGRKDEKMHYLGRQRWYKND